jgi:hypothetical protein
VHKLKKAEKTHTHTRIKYADDDNDDDDNSDDDDDDGVSSNNIKASLCEKRRKNLHEDIVTLNLIHCAAR